MFKWPKWLSRRECTVNTVGEIPATTDNRVADETSPTAVTMIHPGVFCGDPGEYVVIRENIEQRYRDWGEFVDLGSWVGGSTLSLAEGLATNRCVA